MAKINTKVVFEWNSKSKKYEEIYSDSYEYDGEVAQLQQGTVITRLPLYDETDNKKMVGPVTGSFRRGKAYRDTPEGEKYLGEFLNSGNPIKTELLRGKNDAYTRKSLYGFKTAEGDTSYYETNNWSRNLGMLRNKESADIRRAVIGGRAPVDLGETSGKDYVANWGTPPVAEIKKDVTNKIMGFLKGLGK
jgi:hypothetical protein